VANVVFGHEILWLNSSGQLAAVMTFAGRLPMEAVRTEYEPGFTQLFRSGVAEEMRIGASLESKAHPEQSGTFVISGATLVDGTDHAPIPDSVVIVRSGRILKAGTRNQVVIPKNMKVVDAHGQTLLPGLWDMHAHVTGVEIAPAYLAAGVTTVRDCGGEFDFLTAERDAVNDHHGLGPRLLLAGLVDGSGPKGYGATFADTPEEARAVVARYKAAGFQQIKLYDSLKPDVVAALAREAHHAGMTVTGHIPAALDGFKAIEAGMDQINHLYPEDMMQVPGAADDAPINLNSEQATKAIRFLHDRRTVIDPTASWEEMAGHPTEVAIESFEPGIRNAPFTLRFQLSTLRTATTTARFRADMANYRTVIGALFKAGIPIVPGSDTGLLGYGLVRELELYVDAGMKPIEVIQAATIVSARTMKLEGDSGTIEAGKRADLILVNGNPMENIRDLRKVSRVVANGRMYESGRLWKSVGFREP